MAKKTKKVDVKMEAKLTVAEVVANALKEAGFEVHDGVDFGFSKGAVLVRTEATDVQVKLITPKSGLTHYAELSEAVEAEAEAEATE